MKSQSKYFIFGHCRNTLCRLILHDLKTFKFLACTSRTDFDESPSPAKHLFSNRQAGNLYESFRNLTHSYIRRWGGYTIKTSITETAHRVYVGNDTTSTHTRSEATHSPVNPKRYTVTDPTQVGKGVKKVLPDLRLNNGGLGETLFLLYSTSSLASACR